MKSGLKNEEEEKKKQSGMMKGSMLWIQTDLGLKSYYFTHY